MARDDEFSDRERETIALVARLRADAEVAPLVSLLEQDRHGRERVRDALALLAELDPDLLVQVALDALVNGRLGDLGGPQPPPGRRLAS